MSSPYSQAGGIARPAAGPFGVRVQRAAALVPQTATGSIFRVNGGRCAIYLLGIFAAAASATVTNLTIVNTTSGAAADRGATTSLSSATAITSAAIGSSVTLGATVGAALTIGAGAIIWNLTPHIVNIGTIDLTTSASNATASIRWLLWYIGLDPQAFINTA
jgi:hypothetical protein